MNLLQATIRSLLPLDREARAAAMTRFDGLIAADGYFYGGRCPGRRVRE